MSSSRYLSRAGRPAGRVTHKDTVVWQWLHFAVAGQGDTGDAIRALRKRVDMPNMFPHRTYLRRYLVKAGLSERTAERAHVFLWNLYADYRDAALQAATYPTKGVTRNPWRESGLDQPDRKPRSPSTSSKFLSR